MNKLLIEGLDKGSVDVEGEDHAKVSLQVSYNGCQYQLKGMDHNVYGDPPYVLFRFSPERKAGFKELLVGAKIDGTYGIVGVMEQFPDGSQDVENLSQLEVTVQVDTLAKYFIHSLQARLLPPAFMYRFSNN